MGLTHEIDVYCERIDPSFWSEPVNALTNFSFIAAGIFLLWRIPGRFERILSANLIAIGIGSFLFHTFAQRWAAAVDVLPILTFIIISTYGIFYRYLEWSVVRSCAGTVLVLGTSILLTHQIISYVAIDMNGSEYYLFALFVLLGSGFFVKLFYPNSAKLLLAAASIFIVSLLFRSMDMAVCPTLPVGTHFVWHVLNTLTLTLIILAFHKKRS